MDLSVVTAGRSQGRAGSAGCCELVLTREEPVFSRGEPTLCASAAAPLSVLEGSSQESPVHREHVGARRCFCVFWERPKRYSAPFLRATHPCARMPLGSLPSLSPSVSGPLPLALRATERTCNLAGMALAPPAGAHPGRSQFWKPHRKPHRGPWRLEVETLALLPPC